MRLDDSERDQRKYYDSYYRRSTVTNFNFHIGLPRIAANFLSSVAAEPMMRTETARYIVPPKRFTQDFRSLINRKQTKGGPDMVAWRKAMTFLRDVASFETVAFSQHALLGTPHEIVSDPHALIRAAERMTRLSDIFQNHPVAIHITIMNQVNYLSSIMEEPVASSITFINSVSWSVLIAALRAATPERHFIVWDFQQPKQIALRFLESMLNLNDIDLLAKYRASVQQNLISQMAGTVLAEKVELSDHWKARYDEDLNEIEQMKGVTLVRGDSVPSYYHL